MKLLHASPHFLGSSPLETAVQGGEQRAMVVDTFWKREGVSCVLERSQLCGIRGREAREGVVREP